MNVPFVDLRAQYASIKGEIAPAIDEVLESAAFIMGPQIARFEREYASYIGTRHCVGVESGTAALKLALQALGINSGDEVVIPANTFIASAEAITATGATPVLVDMDDAYLMDASALEAAITPRTKALMPVHLYGQVVPMEPILEVARRHGLRVVEDASQAHGARWQGRRAGSIGDVGCFSFYPAKNLGCYGDGGALVTGDDALAERVRLLQDFGQKKKYVHSIKGDNCRLDSIQAAVLSVKLPHLDAWNDARRAHARRYDERLGELGFPVPKRHSDEAHVYHLYVTEVPGRDAVRERLTERGVHSGIHYPIPIHLQPAYSELAHLKGRFPLTEVAAEGILSLPMFPEMTEAQIDYVVDTLHAVAKPLQHA